MEHNGTTYIFPMSGRKAWHHDIPDSWKEEAFERFNYVECAVFSKLTENLTADDLKLVAYHGEPGEEFIMPSGFIPPPTVVREDIAGEHKTPRQRGRHGKSA